MFVILLLVYVLTFPFSSCAIIVNYDYSEGMRILEGNFWLLGLVFVIFILMALGLFEQKDDYYKLRCDKCGHLFEHKYPILPPKERFYGESS